PEHRRDETEPFRPRARPEPGTDREDLPRAPAGARVFTISTDNRRTRSMKTPPRPAACCILLTAGMLPFWSAAGATAADKDSDILLHCQGEDGGFGPWMESYECQMIEGGTGDFLVLSGKTKRSLTVEVEKRPTGEGEKKHNDYYYKPGGETVTLTAGRFNWYG